MDDSDDLAAPDGTSPAGEAEVASTARFAYSVELARGLSDVRLAAIAALERRVVEADGGRLKLEWGTLRSRSGDRVEDLLCWDGQRLLGFLGLYAFGAPTVELAGMVDPSARRRGIGTALLDAALPLCRAAGYGRTLLVTPRTPAAGRAFALARSGTLDHSEHALRLSGPPAPGPSSSRISLREMTEDDVTRVSALLQSGFGWESSELVAHERVRRDQAETVVVERDGAIVGCLRVIREGDLAGVYGFVIDAAHRGLGIGRDVLCRICQRAVADGAAQVHLEVAVDNERALGLYTSLGFTPISTEDYYAL